MLAGLVVMGGGVSVRAAEVPAIALGDSAVAKQLQQWWAEGTAAGNVGDFYDNRDRLHANLQVKQLFPQLSRVEYTTNDVKANRDYGPALRVHEGVTIGNSSTARAAIEGGSNARTLYARADGLDLLHAQYRANNLYVYPEHQDHDPGSNGHGGYGDLIPANTPYLLVSQGSSTSDLPFVRAAVYTLAAFRPETKKRLAEAGLLMPTLQMLFRWCATNVVSEADYLSGKAHPTAFDPAVINTLRMCRTAHEILPDALPPLAQIEVVREDRSRGGIHSFDSAASEVIGDSPCAVARLWRSSTTRRHLAVSAQSSLDPQGRALTFQWVVLRGDTNQVEIRPLNEAGSVVEISASWPQRRPVTDGAALESTRIDIGVFVHNGMWWSPPAFVTWFASDREARTMDDQGRVLEVGYFAGAPFLELAEVSSLATWLKAEPRSASASAFAQMLGPEETAQLLQGRGCLGAVRGRGASGAPGADRGGQAVSRGTIRRAPTGNGHRQEQCQGVVGQASHRTASTNAAAMAGAEGGRPTGAGRVGGSSGGRAGRPWPASRVA
jgi:hypothetical protein